MDNLLHKSNFEENQEKTRDGIIYDTFCKIKDYIRAECYPLGERLTLDIFTEYVEFLVDEEKKSF